MNEGLKTLIAKEKEEIKYLLKNLLLPYGRLFYSKYTLKINLWEEAIKKLKKEKLPKEVLVKADLRRRRKNNY